jgi:hypothetical protein
MFRFSGLGFQRVGGSRFRDFKVQGPRCRVLIFGFRVLRSRIRGLDLGLRSMVQSSKFLILGLEFRI